MGSSLIYRFIYLYIYNDILKIISILYEEYKYA